MKVLHLLNSLTNFIKYNHYFIIDTLDCFDTQFNILCLSNLVMNRKERFLTTTVFWQLVIIFVFIQKNYYIFESNIYKVALNVMCDAIEIWIPCDKIGGLFWTLSSLLKILLHTLLWLWKFSTNFCYLSKRDRRINYIGCIKWGMCVI